MKIGLVIESFDPRRGGAEQWTWQLAAWLVRHDYEVHVVAARWSEAVDELGVVCHAVRRSRSKTGFAEAAAEALAPLRLDVVHDMGCGWSCDVLQPHFGSRAALERHSLPLTPAWLRPIKRRVAPWLPRYRDYRRLTRAQYGHKQRLFLAVSQMVADDLAADYGVDRDQIRVVHNGVDVERFSPAVRDEHRDRVRASLGVADDELLVLIVAHNLRLKGVPALAAAIERLAAAGRRVRLAVVGGKLRAGQIDAPGATRHDCGEKPTRSSASVYWLGAVDDPRPYYAAADVYAQPTLYDACSLVVLEAMACGLPVITTRNNGASELVANGSAGYVLDEPQDVAALSTAIERLIQRPLRAHMGESARQAAIEHGIEANFRRVERVYAEVAAAKQAARRAA